jgi:hypothetical protein
MPRQAPPNIPNGPIYFPPPASRVDPILISKKTPFTPQKNFNLYRVLIQVVFIFAA